MAVRTKKEELDEVLERINIWKPRIYILEKRERSFGEIYEEKRMVWDNREKYWKKINNYNDLTWDNFLSRETAEEYYSKENKPFYRECHIIEFYINLFELR